MKPLRPPPNRIPDARLDKARFYLAHAQHDLASGKLQSAENFLRLATLMDPASAQARAALEAVVRQRAGKPT